MEAPLYHITANAGLEGAVIINKVREQEPGIGFDAYKEEYVDKGENPVISDPSNKIENNDLTVYSNKTKGKTVLKITGDSLEELPKNLMELKTRLNFLKTDSYIQETVLS